MFLTWLSRGPRGLRHRYFRFRFVKSVLDLASGEARSQRSMCLMQVLQHAVEEHAGAPKRIKTPAVQPYCHGIASRERCQDATVGFVPDLFGESCGGQYSPKRWKRIFAFWFCPLGRGIAILWARVWPRAHHSGESLACSTVGALGHADSL